MEKEEMGCIHSDEFVQYRVWEMLGSGCIICRGWRGYMQKMCFEIKPVRNILDKKDFQGNYKFR